MHSRICRCNLTGTSACMPMEKRFRRQANFLLQLFTTQKRRGLKSSPAVSDRWNLLFRSSALDFELVTGASLRAGKAGGKNAEGRAGNVIHSYLVAELY